jgi:NitT/TauT family transport system ATP-binding protein
MDARGMTGAGSARIALEHVGYVYAGDPPTRALQRLTLAVHDAEFLAVVGPLGCGTTTLLRLIAGFLGPSEGRVLADGVPVSGPSPARGCVFAEDAIFPWMTVAGNVEFGLLAKGTPRAAREAIVRELVALIGLEPLARAYPRALPAGVAKLVEITRVLAPGPAVLLLDEPFGSLDAQTRARMHAALGRLCAPRRTAVVLATHDVDEALRLADRVVVLSPRPGRVVLEVPVAVPRPRTLDTLLSPPFTALRRTIWSALAPADA